MGSETETEFAETGIEIKEEKVSEKVTKKHVCPYEGCELAFNRPSKLNRHINTHTKQRLFKCDFPGCTKDYTNKSHLDRHKSMSHSENKPLPLRIPCPYPECSKVFMNKWSLKRHSNTHKHVESYNCTQCEATFKKSKQLKQHVNFHLGYKTYVCETCKEVFETKADLNSHNKTHKVYICEYLECRQVFNTWNELRKHEKLSHFTVFTCETCDKTFKNKWTLTEHVFSHLPDHKRDAYACPYINCGRFYFHQRNLEHHLKSFHEDINHECENCGRSFVKRETLIKHLRLHQPGYRIVKVVTPKVKKPRKPRYDIGQPRKSMAALLSGIVLPYHINKSLAQNNITIEVIEGIQNVKNKLLKEN